MAMRHAPHEIGPPGPNQHAPLTQMCLPLLGCHTGCRHVDLHDVGPGQLYPECRDGAQALRELLRGGVIFAQPRNLRRQGFEAC